MKTSNIILLVVTGSITLLIISGAMNLRFSGTRGGEVGFENNQVESMNKKMENLQDFTTLSIVDVDITVKFSEKSGLEYISSKELELPVVNYRYEGDTLIVDHISRSEINGHSQVIIHLDKNQYYTLKGTQSHLTIENCQTELLTLFLNDSEIYMSGKHANNIGKLILHADNRSNINMHHFRIDTLEMQLNDSRAMLESSMGIVKGFMKNHSELSAKSIDDFAFSKDRTSRFNHWNN